MKVYLAACFEQQEEVRSKAVDLQSMGIECTSRWRFEVDPPGGSTEEFKNRCASYDLEDIRRADVFLLLTNKTSTRGGKHVETGYALALGKPIVLCGGRRENVFHSLTGITHANDWDEARAILNTL